MGQTTSGNLGIKMCALGIRKNRPSTFVININGQPKENVIEYIWEYLTAN